MITSLPQITVHELKTWQEAHKPFVLLDVRQDWERDIATISPDLHIPLANLSKHSHLLNPDHTIVVYCHHGLRSAYATQWLREQGYPEVYNLHQGIHAWSLQIDSQCKTY